MAVRAPGYVEPWDSTEFPYYRDRSGLRFWRERVVLTAEGEVLRGHLTVANAIAEAWCNDNPTLLEGLLDAWMDKARAADDEDKESRRREDERLAYHPHLAEALQRSAAKVFEQAGLTPHQVRVLELRLDGKSFTEIGFAFSVSKQMAAEYVDKALEKILALDGELPLALDDVDVEDHAESTEFNEWLRDCESAN